MAQKELRKMSRTELIEIIYALQQNEKSLRMQNKDLHSRLEDKILRINQAGSIAEAALSLNRIFEDADNACKQYIDSIQNSEAEHSTVIEQAKAECDALREQAEAECAVLRKQTEEECAAMLRKTRTECAAIKKQTEEQRKVFLRQLRALIEKYPDIAKQTLVISE